MNGVCDRIGRRGVWLKRWLSSIGAACLVIPQAQPNLMQAPPQSQTVVKVRANLEWEDTGIEVLPGDQLAFLRVSGKWSNGGGSPQKVGPLGFVDLYVQGTQLPDVPLAAPIGRIGEFKFAVKANEQFPITVRGRLYLGMNDVPGTYDDNTGSMMVVIQHVARPIALPDFTGHSHEEAVEFLKRYGFIPKLRPGPSKVSEGRIFGQMPDPGTDLHEVERVVLYVSTGPTPIHESPNAESQRTEEVEVPRVLGMSLSEAESDLKRADLMIGGVVRKYSLAVPDRVLRQDPRPGEKVAPGTSVALIVSMSWGVLLALIGTTLVISGATFKVAKSLKDWISRPTIEISATLDTDRLARIVEDELPTVAPNVDLQAHLEMGPSCAEGSVPVVRQEVSGE